MQVSKEKLFELVKMITPIKSVEELEKNYKRLDDLIGEDKEETPVYLIEYKN
jgi:hypothetical protein